MTTPTTLRSAIYEGTVTHRRPGPDGHRFSQSVRMLLVDLDEIESVCRLHPLWSAKHPSPVQVRRADYLGDSTVPLTRAAAELVEERTGTRPQGPIALLTNPRTWGWLSNPISCYFCFDAGGTEVVSFIAEVTNTPWHERHCYVVGPPGFHEFDKALHVSPFLSMGQRYELAYSPPGADLTVTFMVQGVDGPSLYAGMRLHRKPVNRRTLGQMVWAPLQGGPGTSLGIYRQAATLWRKHTTVYRHPKSGRATSPSSAVGTVGPTRGVDGD